MPNSASAAVKPKMEAKKYILLYSDYKKYLVWGLLSVLIVQIIDLIVFKFFSYSINSYLIFGLLGNNIIAILISLIILALLITFSKKYFGFGLILLTTGLISNMLDRLIYGGVIDYFNLWSIPKFNLADVLIVAGVIFFGLKILRAT